MKIQRELSLLILFYCANAKVLHERTSPTHSRLRYSSDGPSTTDSKILGLFESAEEKPHKHTLYKLKRFGWSLKEQSEFKNDHLVPHADLGNKISASISKVNKKLRKHEKKKKLQIQANTKQTRARSRSKRSIQVNGKPVGKSSPAPPCNDEEIDITNYQKESHVEETNSTTRDLHRPFHLFSEENNQTEHNETNIHYKTINKEKAIEGRILVTPPPLVRLKSSPGNSEEDNNTNIEVEENVRGSLHAFQTTENQTVENTFEIAEARDRSLVQNETNIDLNTEKSSNKILKSLPIKHLETSKRNIGKQLRDNRNITETKNTTFEEVDLHRLLYLFPKENKQNDENTNKTSTIEQNLALLNNSTKEDIKIINKEDTSRKCITEEAVPIGHLKPSQENKKDNKIIVDCTNDDQIKQTLAEYVNFDSVIFLNSAEEDTLNIKLADTVGSQQEDPATSTNQPISLRNVTASSFSYEENSSRINGANRKDLEEEKTKTMEGGSLRLLQNDDATGINKTKVKIVKENVSPINSNTTKEMSLVSKNTLKAKNEKLTTTERSNVTNNKSDLSQHIQSSKNIILNQTQAEIAGLSRGKGNTKCLNVKITNEESSNQELTGSKTEINTNTEAPSRLDSNLKKPERMPKLLSILINQTQTENKGLSRCKGNTHRPNVTTINEESSNKEPKEIRTTETPFKFQTVFKNNRTEINSNTEGPSKLDSNLRKPEAMLKWLSVVLNRTQTEIEGLLGCNVKTTNEEPTRSRTTKKPCTLPTVYKNSRTEINTNTEGPSKLDSNLKKCETLLKLLSIFLNRTETEIEGLLGCNVKTTNEESSNEEPKEIRTTEKPFAVQTVLDHKNIHTEININAETPNRPDLNSKKSAEDMPQVVHTMKNISNLNRIAEMLSQTESSSESSPSNISIVAKNEESEKLEPDLGKRNKTCIINTTSNVTETKPLKSADQVADTFETSKTPKKLKVVVEVSRSNSPTSKEENNTCLISEPKYGKHPQSREDIETIFKHSEETSYEYSAENEKPTYTNNNNDTSSGDNLLLEHDKMCDLKSLITSLISKRVLNLTRLVCDIVGRLFRFPKRIFFNPLLRICNRVLNISNKIINPSYFVGLHNRNQDLAIYHKKQRGKKSHKLRSMLEDEVSKVLRLVSLVVNRIRYCTHDQQCENSYSSEESPSREDDLEKTRVLLRRRRHLTNTGNVMEHKISSEQRHILNLQKLKSAIHDILMATSLYDHVNHKSKSRPIPSMTAQKLHKRHRHSNKISNVIKRHVEPEKSNNKVSNSVRYRADLESNESSDNLSDDNEDIPPYPHKNSTPKESVTNAPAENEANHNNNNGLSKSVSQKDGMNSNTALSGPIRVGVRSFIGDLINARVYDLIEYIADIFKTFLTNLLTKLFNFGFGGADMILYVGLAVTVGITSGILCGAVMLIGSAFIKLISFDNIPSFIKNIVTAPFRYLFQDILSIINDLNFGVIFKKLYNILLNIYHRVVSGGDAHTRT